MQAGGPAPMQGSMSCMKLRVGHTPMACCLWCSSKAFQPYAWVLASADRPRSPHLHTYLGLPLDVEPAVQQLLNDIGSPSTRSHVQCCVVAC